jgi:hypothetical protein
MLDRKERPLRSDRFQSGGGDAPAEPTKAAPRQGSNASDDLDTFLYGFPGRLIQPRLVVGLALIACGIVWAIARGLTFYGLTPAHIGYDLDQPPLLLVLVGIWLLFRSRRR